jgi:hypothetical protein
MRVIIPAVLGLLVLASTVSAETENDLYVTVHLRSGARLEGIMRGGMEVLKNGKFRPVKGEVTKNTGHRIWHSTGTNGFIFVSHLDIVRIENRGPVTSEQQKGLEATLKALRDAAAASRAQARKDLAALRERHKAEKVAEEVGEKDAVEVARKRAEEEKASKREQILERFPPAEWTPERREQIRANLTIRGVAPSADENAWIEAYDEWKEAYDAWMKAEEKKKAEEKAEKKPEEDSPEPDGSTGGESTKPSR